MATTVGEFHRVEKAAARTWGLTLAAYMLLLIIQTLAIGGVLMYIDPHLCRVYVDAPHLTILMPVMTALVFFVAHLVFNLARRKAAIQSDAGSRVFWVSYGHVMRFGFFVIVSMINLLVYILTSDDMIKMMFITGYVLFVLTTFPRKSTIMRFIAEY
ncbi:MAG: hypothetical protein CL946_12165 [Ectothiorhodospiraceae bacterium]|nr:hypothetical protein [Ectothiorhodospiraceae bacterium]